MKIGEVKRLSDVLLENYNDEDEEFKGEYEPKSAAKVVKGHRDFSLIDLDDDLLSAD